MFFITGLTAIRGRGGLRWPPLCFFWHNLLQEEEDGGASYDVPLYGFFKKKKGRSDGPPCVFLAEFVAGGGKGGSLMPPLWFFRVLAAWAG